MSTENTQMITMGATDRPLFLLGSGEGLALADTSRELALRDGSSACIRLVRATTPGMMAQQEHCGAAPYFTKQ